MERFLPHTGSTTHIPPATQTNEHKTPRRPDTTTMRQPEGLTG